MKPSFTQWPARRRFTLFFGVLLLLVIFVFTIERFVGFRQNLLKQTAMFVEVVAKRSSSALVANDKSLARQSLKIAESFRSMEALCLFNSEGIVFSSFITPFHQKKSQKEATPCSKGEFQSLFKVDRQTRFTVSSLDVVQPIIVNEKIIGHLGVRANLQEFNKRYFGFIVAVVAVALFLLWLFQLFFMRELSRIFHPLSLLDRNMQEVTEKMDFSLRIPEKGTGEGGELINGFNDMVKEIQKRNDKTTKQMLLLEGMLQNKQREIKVVKRKLVKEIEGKKKVENRLVLGQKRIDFGLLAGDVVHDLNNMLSGVVSYPELLLMDLPEDSRLRVPLETVYDSGKKATAIVQDLLTLSRSGDIKGDKVNLQKIVEEYIASPECTELLAFNPEVEIRLQVLHNITFLHGSPFHLTKMIMNLVSNAAEAIEEKGKIILRIDRVQVSEAPKGLRKKEWEKGEFILLCIIDDGLGIPLKYQEGIFEPFYSKKEMGKSGTGLGMAIIWETVEEHQGMITLASEENVGTTINIYFPAVCQ